MAFTRSSDNLCNDSWFIDNGCSRHMTDSFENLIDFVDLDGGVVVFTDGSRGKILGKGKSPVNGFA